MKFLLQNGQKVSEQVSRFNFVGCDISYGRKNDIIKELNK